MSIIPRNAKKLKVTFKVATSAHNIGETAIVQKNSWGYWSDGKHQYMVAMLRNPEVCQVEVLW